MLDDIRHALRRLRHQPATAAAVAAMLALAIGLTTAMFAIVDSVLLRPVPFPDADRLAHVAMFSDRGGRYAVSADVWRAWTDASVFDAVAGAAPGTTVIEAGTGVLARSSARVAPGTLEMLGVRPLRGRLFAPGEGRAGTDDVVVLSEEIWRSAYGAGPALVGSRVRLDQRDVLVVGILPAGIRFPTWDTTVWQPLDFLAPSDQLRTTLPVAYVRMPRAMPEDDVLARATAVAHAVDPSTRDLKATRLPLLRTDRTDDAAFPLLAGGVGLVFLVLCANGCALLLARVSTRRRELATSLALGAVRGRLIRQVLVEVTVVAAVAVVTGIGLAWAFIEVSRGLLPEALFIRTLNPMAIDMRAVLVAAGAGVFALVVAGCLPAWTGTRIDPASTLQGAGRAGTETRLARLATRTLLVAEVALACTLLIGATVLVRSFVNLTRVERGLDTQGVTTLWLSLPTDRFADRPARLNATARLEEEARAWPGVTQVALSFGVPPGGGAIHFADDWRGDDDAVPQLLVVDSYRVGPEFFDVFGIARLAGRTFEPGEPDQHAIVGQDLAARLWPDRDPVGRSFRFGNQSFTVIGLVRELQMPSLDSQVNRPEFYVPFQPGGGQVMVGVKCEGRCPDDAAIRHRLAMTVPGARVVEVNRLDETFAREVARPRAAATLASAFSLVAIVAAAAGLWAVLTFAVRRRRREFGIRLALGASPGLVRAGILREGAVVAGLGLACGALTGWWLVQTMTALQYGVSVADRGQWLVVAGVVALTTLLASWRPARQAARTNPATLLRDE